MSIIEQNFQEIKEDFGEEINIDLLLIKIYKLSKFFIASNLNLIRVMVLCNTINLIMF